MPAKKPAKKKIRRAGTIIPLGVQRSQPETPIRYVFNVPPMPASRGRTGGVSKTGKKFVYTDPRYRAFKDSVAEATAAQHPVAFPFTGDLRADILFFCPSRKRGDKDNLEKAVYDGMQDIAFVNDIQIWAGEEHIAISRKRPRIEIILSAYTVLDEDLQDAKLAGYTEVDDAIGVHDCPF